MSDGIYLKQNRTQDKGIYEQSHIMLIKSKIHNEDINVWICMWQSEKGMTEDEMAEWHH